MKLFCSIYIGRSILSFAGAQIQFWRVDDPDEVRSTDIITGPPANPCPVYNIFPEQLLRRRRSPVHGAVDELWPFSNIRAGVLVLNHGSAGKLSDTIDFNTPEGGTGNRALL